MDEFVTCCQLCLMKLRKYDMLNTRNENKFCLEKVSVMFGFEISESPFCSKKVCAKCSFKIKEMLLYQSEVLINQNKVNQFISLQEELANLKNEVMALRDDEDNYNTKSGLLTSDQETIGNFELLDSNNDFVITDSIKNKDHCERILARGQKRLFISEPTSADNVKKLKIDKISQTEEHDQTKIFQQSRVSFAVKDNNANVELNVKDTKPLKPITYRRNTISANRSEVLEQAVKVISNEPATCAKPDGKYQDVHIIYLNKTVNEKIKQILKPSPENTKTAAKTKTAVNPQKTICKPVNTIGNRICSTVIKKRFSDEFELSVAKHNAIKRNQTDSDYKKKEPTSTKSTSISLNKPVKTEQVQIITKSNTIPSATTITYKIVPSSAPKAVDSSVYNNFRMLNSNYGSIQIPIGSSIPAQNSTPVEITQSAPTPFPYFSYNGCSKASQNNVQKPWETTNQNFSQPVTIKKYIAHPTEVNPRTDHINEITMTQPAKYKPKIPAIVWLPIPASTKIAKAASTTNNPKTAIQTYIFSDVPKLVVPSSADINGSGILHSKSTNANTIRVMTAAEIGSQSSPVTSLKTSISHHNRTMPQTQVLVQPQTNKVNFSHVKKPVATTQSQIEINKKGSVKYTIISPSADDSSKIYGPNSNLSSIQFQ